MTAEPVVPLPAPRGTTDGEGIAEILTEIRAVAGRLDRLEAAVGAAVDNLPLRYRILIRGAMNHGTATADTAR